MKQTFDNNSKCLLIHYTKTSGFAKLLNFIIVLYFINLKLNDDISIFLL